MRKKILTFVRKEMVLSVAAVLAVCSAFLVHPDGQYADYIDFRTLAILFCLMCVMAGLQKIGVFRRIAERLLQKVHGNTQVILILVLLCFFFSMLITNDVALITFVPFTFTVGKLLGERIYRKMMLPTVVLQTIAANLGSMLTPIGNPQNLYLYGLSGMGAGRFVRLMLPYTLLSLLLLLVSCILFGRLLNRGENAESTVEKIEAEKAEDTETKRPETMKAERAEESKAERLVDTETEMLVYLILFVLCLLTVARILPMPAMLLLVTIAVFLLDRSVFARVDYCLLFTFIAFFVFIGNMGRIPAFADVLKQLVEDHEVAVAVIASQFISNVPAALLLSGFTTNLSALIIGVNLGGMGTLIASMASLISYKYVAVEVRSLKMEGGRSKYLLYFTVACLAFLTALSVLYCVLGAVK